MSIEKLFNRNLLIFCNKTVWSVPPRLGTSLSPCIYAFSGLVYDTCWSILYVYILVSESDKVSVFSLDYARTVMLLIDLYCCVIVLIFVKGCILSYMTLLLWGGWVVVHILWVSRYLARWVKGDVCCVMIYPDNTDKCGIGV